ncbi:MAG: hypothetical protein ACI8RZ_001527 [Myxococcota bacterium]|jgi:hypothetical protein
MKNYTWMLLSASLLTFACDGGKDTGDDAEADADTDTDTDSDTDTDADIEHSYTSYEGWESYDYNNGTYPAGEYNCQLVWDLVGSPVTPIDSGCDNCEFAFDVTYTYRDADYTYDDGTCGTDGASGTYAYSGDFDGYGGSWVFDYYGTFYWWGYGAFSGDQFDYYWGYVDDAYGAYYYTYYQYGIVTVQ